MSCEVDLLPCPFCGGAAKRHDIEAREDVDNAGASYIECTGCGACTQLHFDRKENLIDSWNRRVNSSGDWRCAANPHGVVPQDCDWPNCGCDPHAERVIFGLVECGWESPQAVGQMQSRIKELRGALADAWQGFREKGHFNEAERIEASMPDLKTLAGVAEQSGAGAPETSVRCGAPAANKTVS
jgi:Lar family restriction alleviation protein